jgi:hypothetical protein
MSLICWLNDSATSVENSCLMKLWLLPTPIKNSSLFATPELTDLDKNTMLGELFPKSQEVKVPLQLCNQLLAIDNSWAELSNMRARSYTRLLNFGKITNLDFIHSACMTHMFHIGGHKYRPFPLSQSIFLESVVKRDTCSKRMQSWRRNI